MLFRTKLGILLLAGLFLSSTLALVSAAPGSERQRVLAVMRPTDSFQRPEPYELRPAGASTVFKLLNRDIFSHASTNMPFERELEFKVGNGIFKKVWVSSPSSTLSSDGIGPLFSARSCQRCHLKDGRGQPPRLGETAESMIVQLSIPPQNMQEKTAVREHRRSVVPEPVYGSQLQSFSVQGVPSEGKFKVVYEEVLVVLDDGEVVSLRRPTYRFTNLQYGPLHPDVMFSPRIAPPMIGMGLLEAIPEADIVMHADPEDSDGDGISGKVRRVWSDESGQVAVGRFGWKAGQPTVVQQAADAFLGDMGISTALYPVAHGDCTVKQPACRTAPHGDVPETDGIEASSRVFDLLVFYARNLGVPARRNVDDPEVLDGKRLFYEARCVACHVPKFVTRRDSIGLEQSFQLIWPYTDLLLHDMGEELADHRPEGNASGREWRTPPLWGIGLTETVSGQTSFLHDGRARTLLEAILWHGGEAEASKLHVMAMGRKERDALLAFLKSL